MRVGEFLSVVISHFPGLSLKIVNFNWIKKMIGAKRQKNDARPNANFETNKP